jgi:hypothetical protein
MIGKSRCNVDKSYILDRVTEPQIAAYYLSISELPTIISSPLRTDNHPSFWLYSPDGNKVRYYDFAKKDVKGGIFDLLQRKLGKSFIDTLDDVHSHIKDISSCHITVVQSNTISEHELVHKLPVQVRSVQRKWQEYDFRYWESYGIPRNWIIHSGTYPISYIITITKSGWQKVTKADKYAYTFVEMKDGKPTEKVYQPFNKNGFKWRNSHDKSVWDLWTKLPPRGEKVIITSSRKDALCVWANTGIPSVSLQSETASIKPQVMQELKDRFKKVYILYDNDFKNEEEKGNNPGREAAKAIAEQFDIVQIEIPTSYKAKDSSDLFKQYGKDIFLKVFKQLIK